MTSAVNKLLSHEDPLAVYGDITLKTDAKSLSKDWREFAFEIVDFVLKHFALQEVGPFLNDAKLNETYLQVKDLYLRVANQVLQKRPLESDKVVKKYLKRFSEYDDEAAIKEKLIEDACNAHDDIISFPHVYKIDSRVDVDLPKRIDEGVPEDEYDAPPKTLSKFFHKHIAHFDGEKWVVWKSLAEEWAHQEILNPFTEILTYRQLMPLRYGDQAPEATFKQFVYRKTLAQLEVCLGLSLPQTGQIQLEQMAEKERIQIVFFLAHPDHKEKKASEFLKICHKVYSLKEELSLENCQILLNWLFDEMENLPEDWEELEYTNEYIEKVRQIQEFLPQERDPKGISFYACHESFKNLELFLELAQSPYLEPQYEKIIKLLSGILLKNARGDLDTVFQYFEQNSIQGRSPDLLTLPLIDFHLHFDTVKSIVEGWEIKVSVADVIAMMRNFHHCINAHVINRFLKDYDDEIKKEIYVGPLPKELVKRWDLAKNSLMCYQKRYFLDNVEFIRFCLSLMSTSFNPIPLANKIEGFIGRNLHKEHFFPILQIEINPLLISNLLDQLQPGNSYYEQKEVLRKISDLLAESSAKEAIMTPLQERIDEIYRR